MGPPDVPLLPGECSLPTRNSSGEHALPPSAVLPPFIALPPPPSAASCILWAVTRHSISRAVMSLSPEEAPLSILNLRASRADDMTPIASSIDLPATADAPASRRHQSFATSATFSMHATHARRREASSADSLSSAAPSWRGWESSAAATFARSSLLRCRLRDDAISALIASRTSFATDSFISTMGAEEEEEEEGAISCPPMAASAAAAANTAGAFSNVIRHSCAQ
mmetsp:Transcript_25711/g.75852  ORF Transcript_25711/g.75852 Transcript_25711/m.75852 type:complete len:226 (+) Transcript_25711:858-1535(+)